MQHARGSTSHKAIHAYLLLLPAFVLLLAFTHVPAVATLIDSFFSTPRGSRPGVWVGLENYEQMVHDPVFWKAASNNLWFALATIPLSIGLALVMALWVNERIAGRGLLRELLGRYLDRPAAALRFGRGAHGKPVLAGADAGAGLHFNLSHSGNQVLYAVALREVGVDLERLDLTVSYALLAERICTPREWAAFRTVPAELLREAFFACWTRKEAIAKALGGGLASGLRTLDVCCREDILSDGRASLRDGQGCEWSVLNLELGSGWIGALAAIGADWRWRKTPLL